MGKKTTSALSSRAWNLLRLALFWARKGGIFKRTALLQFLKNLRPAHRGRSLNYSWGEREFSFDDTPMFKFKQHRSSSSMRFPSIPCINPSGVVVDDFYDEDEDEVGDISRSSEYDDHPEFDCESSGNIDDLGGEEQGIDSKAEEFIARFHEQMKLQRQISYFEYTEMLQRSVS